MGNLLILLERIERMMRRRSGVSFCKKSFGEEKNKYSGVKFERWVIPAVR